LDYLLPLTNPIFYSAYVTVRASAVLLFLTFYITALITQRKKTSIVPPVSVPLWLNIIYPSWLDKLTLRNIIIAFALGLGMAIILWVVLALIFLAITARAY
jgi:hypothetical protein